jgi:hypothetical protein
MPTNKNNPPKPQTNKDQKVTDLPQKKGNANKESEVKGGRAVHFQEVDP